MPNESVFVTKSKDVDEQQKKNDILNVIESCNDFQDFIKKLEEKKLIWYFIGPLLQDKDIRKQASSKWNQELEQSIDATHRKLEALLPGQSFSAYSTKVNNFNIRFEEEKSIEISDILKAGNEDEVYHISLEEDGQMTACKKNGNERYYDLTGSGSCEMTINWQAKDFKGNSIDCSMTVEVDSIGIKRMVSEPKFGDLKFTDPLSEETRNKILELVAQNKEVFINGKTLYQAFTDMGKSVDDQQVPAEEIFTKDLPTPSSSGYSSPGSRRSSVSSEFSDEFESDTSDDEEEYEQEESKVDEIIGKIEKLKSEIKKLEEEKEALADYFAVQAKQLEDLRLERDSLKSTLAELQKGYEELAKTLCTTEEELADEREKRLAEMAEKEKELADVTDQLRAKLLENQELAEKLSQLQKDKEDLEMAIQQLSIGEKSLADELREARKDEKIERLKEEIKQKDEKIQQIARENQKLEGKLQDLRAKYLEVENEDREYIENLTCKLKQAESEFIDNIDNKDKLIDQIEELEEEKENLLKQLRAKGTDSASFRKQQSEIDRLKQQLKEKEEMLTHTQEELKSVKESLEQLQSTLQQQTVTQTEVEYEGTSMQQNDVQDQEEAQNIMDWPVPIPDDKPEEQKTPLEPIKTELSDPNSIPAKGPEKSRS